jgi:hypothetical protein|tara:strand:+ start:359 stop:520 length:162 start_codon:yes stop_codon:yes gene_type:complete
MSRIKNFIAWVKFLNKEDGSWSYFSMLEDAWYNSKHWKPTGTWPYGMDKNESK